MFENQVNVHGGENNLVKIGGVIDDEIDYCKECSPLYITLSSGVIISIEYDDRIRCGDCIGWVIREHYIPDGCNVQICPMIDSAVIGSKKPITHAVVGNHFICNTKND